jgi:hypothetical protein
MMALEPRYPKIEWRVVVQIFCSTFDEKLKPKTKLYFNAVQDPSFRVEGVARYWAEILLLDALICCHRGQSQKSLRRSMDQDDMFRRAVMQACHGATSFSTSPDEWMVQTPLPLKWRTFEGFRQDTYVNNKCDQKVHIVFDACDLTITSGIELKDAVIAAVSRIWMESSIQASVIRSIRLDRGGRERGGRGRGGGGAAAARGGGGGGGGGWGDIGSDLFLDAVTNFDTVLSRLVEFDNGCIFFFFDLLFV